MHALAPEVQRPTELPPCGEPVLGTCIIHQEECLHDLGLSTRGNTQGSAGHLAVVRRMQVHVAAVAKDVIAEAELSFACARFRI